MEDVRRELRQRNKEVTEKEEDHSYDKGVTEEKPKKRKGRIQIDGKC